MDSDIPNLTIPLMTDFVIGKNFKDAKETINGKKSFNLLF
jgi:hypothetical protein